MAPNIDTPTTKWNTPNPTTTTTTTMTSNDSIHNNNPPKFLLKRSDGNHVNRPSSLSLLSKTATTSSRQDTDNNKNNTSISLHKQEPESSSHHDDENEQDGDEQQQLEESSVEDTVKKEKDRLQMENTSDVTASEQVVAEEQSASETAVHPLNKELNSPRAEPEKTPRVRGAPRSSSFFGSLFVKNEIASHIKDNNDLGDKQQSEVPKDESELSTNDEEKEDKVEKEEEKAADPTATFSRRQPARNSSFFGSLFVPAAKKELVSPTEILGDNPKEEKEVKENVDETEKEETTMQTETEEPTPVDDTAKDDRQRQKPQRKASFFGALFVPKPQVTTDSAVENETTHQDKESEPSTETLDSSQPEADSELTSPAPVPSNNSDNDDTEDTDTKPLSTLTTPAKRGLFSFSSGSSPKKMGHVADESTPVDATEEEEETASDDNAKPGDQKTPIRSKPQRKSSFFGAAGFLFAPSKDTKVKDKEEVEIDTNGPKEEMNGPQEEDDSEVKEESGAKEKCDVKEEKDDDKEPTLEHISNKESAIVTDTMPQSPVRRKPQRTSSFFAANFLFPHPKRDKEGDGNVEQETLLEEEEEKEKTTIPQLEVKENDNFEDFGQRSLTILECCELQTDETEISLPLSPTRTKPNKSNSFFGNASFGKLFMGHLPLKDDNDAEKSEDKSNLDTCFSETVELVEEEEGDDDDNDNEHKREETHENDGPSKDNNSGGEPVFEAPASPRRQAPARSQSLQQSLRNMLFLGGNQEQTKAEQDLIQESKEEEENEDDAAVSSDLFLRENSFKGLLSSQQEEEDMLGSSINSELTASTDVSKQPKYQRRNKRAQQNLIASTETDVNNDKDEKDEKDDSDSSCSEISITEATDDPIRVHVRNERQQPGRRTSGSMELPEEPMIRTVKVRKRASSSESVFSNVADLEEYEQLRKSRLLVDICDLDFSGLSSVQKRVSFNMDQTKFHKGDVLTEDEWESVWYRHRDFRSFAKQAEAAMAALLEDRKADSKSGKDSLASSPPTPKPGFGVGWPTFRASSSSTHSGPAPIHVLDKAYSTCKRCRSEIGMTNCAELIHKENLESLYLVDLDARKLVMGLEHVLIRQDRGPPLYLVRLILDRVAVLTEKETVGAPKNDNDDEESALDEGNLLLHMSQNVSRPSRILAHQLALAQAAALAKL